MRTQLILLILFLGCSRFSGAQMIKITPEDKERKHFYLLMRDGSVVRGQIVRQDSTVITVKKGNGDMTFVEADQVVRISPDRPGDAVRTAGLSNASAPYTVFVFKDGTQVEGNYIRRDSTMITVRKRNGQLTYFEPELLLRVDTVRAGMESSAQLTANAQEIPNRFSPWLLTGQTAYAAEKGRFYYRNTLLVLNEFDYGLTRNWSVGASINPFIGGVKPGNNARETIMGVNYRFSSKLTFPIGQQFRFGANVTYQPRQNGYFSRTDEEWLVQGLMSFGTSQRNATLGYGMQIYPDGYSTSVKFITAGIMHKLARSLTFISDNTFYLNPYYSGNSALLSVALRIDRRRHAFDLGAFSSIQPSFYYSYTPFVTRAYFAPYIGYKLLIGRD